MRFSYSWLQSFFKKKLPSPEKLAELLTMHSFEVESIEKRQKDVVFDIAILPNRAGDCSSHLGLAREISALLNINLADDYIRKLSPSYVVGGKKEAIKGAVRVKVENRNDCPRYVALAMSGVKVGSSPQWLKDRLQSCGLQPINNIVDIGNYVMLELGQPLHAFDLDEIKGVSSKSQVPSSKQVPNPKSQITNRRIIIRRAKEGEEIAALDGKTYKLKPDILVIADAKSPLAIAGIKGGQRAAIDKNTTNIVIESANFRPGLIRQGSKELGLKTDASWRFERGVDPNLALLAAKRAASLIQEIAGGRMNQKLVDFYPVKTRPKKIIFSAFKASSLLGVEIKVPEAKKIFDRLGLKSKILNTKYQILATIPTWRQDLKIPEDLIEEIIRVKGLNYIPSTMPAVFIKSLPISKRFLENFLRNILKGLGFCEAYTYSFLSKTQIEKFGPTRTAKEKIIELENPLSSAQQYLRPTVTISLLEALEKNLRFFDNVRLFELGKKYYFDKKENPSEKKTLTLTVAETQGGPEPFYLLKGALENIFESLRLPQASFEEYQNQEGGISNPLWHSQKTAKIVAGGEFLGLAGSISALASKSLNIKGKAAIAEIELEKITEILPPVPTYKKPIAFPPLRRDLALLVPLNTKVMEVKKVIEKAGGKLLKEIELFDVYEGKELRPGMKNLAFHLTYLSDKKTLADSEVGTLHQKIIKALEKNPEWKVR